MNRRRLNPRLRIQFLGLCMVAGCSALALRLWWVQVARGAEWTARIRGSSEATVRIPSIRGEIRDRNGASLVQNRASYEVDFYLRSEEHTSELQSHSELVCRLMLEKKNMSIIQ